MKGILFKPDMITAIQEGRKTQTRRLIKHQPQKIWDSVDPVKNGEGVTIGWCFYEKTDPDFHSYLKEKPRYQVGEIIYIKEAWHFLNANYESPLSAEHFGGGNDFAIEYTDGELHWWKDNAGEYNYPLDEKNCSPMFMPAKYARYFIKITNVRIERLESITEEGCITEGITDIGAGDLRGMYAVLWDSINPKHPWSNNGWVWRYEFEKAN